MYALLFFLLTILVALPGGESAFNCTEDEWLIPSTETCVPAGTEQGRPLCKNVTFTREEYEKLKLDNSALRIVQETIGNDQFVHTCFPFTKEFMKCPKWILLENEFETRGGHHLYVYHQKRTYSIGEFKILQEPNSTQEAIVCIDNEISRGFNPIYLYCSVWVISIISLAITFVLCVSVSGLSTYRVVLPSYVACLFIFYVTLVLRTIFPEPLCFFYAIILQFSFLAAFFWLNIICFDIWRSVAKPSMSPSRHRLLAYFFFAWGSPVVLVAIAILFDQTDLVKGTGFHPHFMEKCWFKDTPAVLVFFYGPVTAIIVTNLVFFVLTLIAVRKALKTANDEKKKKPSLWKLSIELVFVMGLCWIMEVVSWAVGGKLHNWYFTDVINGLQGLFILVIIARKPVVIRWFKRKYGKTNKKNVEDGSDVSYVNSDDKKAIGLEKYKVDKTRF